MSSHCVSGRAGGRAGILRAPGCRRAQRGGLGALGKKTTVAFWRFCRQSQWRFVLLWLSPARGWLPRRFPCFGEALPGAAALGRSAVAKCSECPGAAWLSYLPSLGSHSRRPRRPRRTTRGRWHWRGDPADSRISWEAEEEKSVGSSLVQRAPPIPSALPLSLCVGCGAETKVPRSLPSGAVQGKGLPVSESKLGEKPPVLRIPSPKRDGAREGGQEHE